MMDDAAQKNKSTVSGEPTVEVVGIAVRLVKFCDIITSDNKVKNLQSLIGYF